MRTGLAFERAKKYRHSGRCNLELNVRERNGALCRPYQLLNGLASLF